MWDVIVVPIIESHIEKSNHAYESYVKTMKDMDNSCKNLANYEDEELTNSNFDVAFDIK